MLIHLKHHCIEAAAKQERRRIVAALLEVDESSERFGRLGNELELLTSFLENSDFRRIRSDRPELAGGSDIFVELTRGEDPMEFHDKLGIYVWGSQEAATYMRGFMPDGELLDLVTRDKKVA